TVLPVNHRLNVSTQVRPAKLAAAEPVVSLPAVRSDHLPLGGAKQLLCDLPAPGSGDVKHRHQRGDHDPQPGTLPRLPPGGLVHPVRGAAQKRPPVRAGGGPTPPTGTPPGWPPAPGESPPRRGGGPAGGGAPSPRGSPPASTASTACSLGPNAPVGTPSGSE